MMTESVIIALISAIASILVVVLQVRAATQNKKDNKKALNNDDDIKSLIKKNTETVKKIDANLKANTQATVATTRSIVRRTYNQLAPDKKISVSDKAMMMELYNAYKSVTLPDGHTPNSFCDAAIAEMNKWEVVPDNSPVRKATFRKPLSNNTVEHKIVTIKKITETKPKKTTSRKAANKIK